MSQKPTKKQAKIVEMPKQDEIDLIDLIAEVEQSLEKMKKDQEEKLTSGIKNFFDIIGTTADKYRTVTGMVVVLQDLQLFGERPSEVTPYDNASLGCVVANKVADRLEAVSETDHIDLIEDLVNIVDNLYVHKFTKMNTWKIKETLEEMQMIKICQQLGPIADNLVEFKKRTDEEIENTERKLANLKTMHGDAENNVQ